MPSLTKEEERIKRKEYNSRPESIRRRQVYYQKNIIVLKRKMALHAKIRLKKRKLKVYNHYSNYDIKCNCCGEKQIEFLTLDHINNDGAEDKKIHRKGLTLCSWLIKNNYPPGFQILCWNCNCAKGFAQDHICPHQLSLAQKLLGNDT